MAHYYGVDGLSPVVSVDAWISGTATLIGDVIVEAGCYIGPSASLRGDFGRIVLRAGSNVQDCCVLHAGQVSDTVVGEKAVVGHGAVLHGCCIGEGALVGMNAVVLDGAVVGAQAIVGALSLVAQRFQVPPRTLVVGAPARVIRALTEQEFGYLREGADEYSALGRRMSKLAGPLRSADAKRLARRAVGGTI